MPENTPADVPEAKNLTPTPADVPQTVEPPEPVKLTPTLAEEEPTVVVKLVGPWTVHSFVATVEVEDGDARQYEISREGVEVLEDDLLDVGTQAGAAGVQLTLFNEGGQK